MNATELARQAYTGKAAPIATPRDAERQVISLVTARLSAAADGATDPGTFPRLAAALHDNRRLWTLLAADVADNANPLPADLRARIFYLAEFTEHHTRRVLSGEADPRALIEINTAIMRGLAGTPVAGVEVTQ